MNDDAQRRFAELYDPVLTEIRRRSAVADTFVDKDLYRLYVAILWANAVSDPADSGLAESELEAFYDFLEARAGEVLGPGDVVVDCFRVLCGPEGEAIMTRHRIPRHHREFLTRFGRLMLDPDGTRSWLGDRLSPR